MKVKLIRHFFSDDPSWRLINEDVPLGTEYEVIGYNNKIGIADMLTGKFREVEMFLLDGNGSIGWIPTDCFEAVKEERENV